MTDRNDLIYGYWKYFVNSTPIFAFQEWFKKESDFLKRNIKKNSIVLDVGIGYGRTIDAVITNAQKLIGIDISSNLIDETKVIARKYPNVEFFCEDARSMHFQNDYFDVVICMGNTFGDFAEDKIKVLNEMKRVCKTNGKIIISVYSEKALPYRIIENKRIGVPIANVVDGTIITPEGLQSEQFTKKKLRDIFNMVKGLDVEIIELNSVSYICVLTKM